MSEKDKAESGKTFGPLVMFVAIAYGIGLIIKLPQVLNVQLGMDLALLPYHHYWFAYSPMLAAFITSAIQGGKDGLSSFIRRAFNFRIKPIWYLIAFLTPVGSALLAMLLSVPMGNNWPDLAQFVTAYRQDSPSSGLLAYSSFGFSLLGWVRKLVGAGSPYMNSKNAGNHCLPPLS